MCYLVSRDSCKRQKIEDILHLIITIMCGVRIRIVSIFVYSQFFYLFFYMYIYYLFAQVLLYTQCSLSIWLSVVSLPTLLQSCIIFYNNDHRRHSVNIWLIYIRMRVESFPCSKELKMTLIMICQNYSLFFFLSLSSHFSTMPSSPFSPSQLTILVTSFRRNVTFPTLYSRWDGYTFQEDLLRRIRKDWRSC